MKQDKQALANLLTLMKRSEVLRASLPPPNVGPLVILHHPNLRDDPRAGAAPSPEEIEQARLNRREILHLRVERAEQGWLLVRVQKEESPRLIWSSEQDAPQTLERVIKIEIDGSESETMEWVPARYGRGCRVPYPPDEDLEI